MSQRHSTSDSQLLISTSFVFGSVHQRHIGLRISLLVPDQCTHSAPHVENIQKLMVDSLIDFDGTDIHASGSRDPL